MQKQDKKIDFGLSSKWLPQVSAPFIYIIDALEKQGIGYNIEEIPISELTPLQPFIDTEKAGSIYNAIKDGSQNFKTIWVAQGNEVLDGHHNLSAAWKENPDGGKMNAIKIMANYQEAARILNGIMDIFNHEYVKSERKNPQTIECYRKEVLRDKSKTGNFFFLKRPKDEKKLFKYQIEFNNLFDTDSLNIKFNESELPTYLLCKHMFPEVRPEQQAVLDETSLEKFCNLFMVKKFKEMGFDGIKYGDLILQAF